MTTAVSVASLRVEHAAERDIQAIVALNNMYAPDGLTLNRSEAFVTHHLQDYQVIRDAEDAVIGQVALDEYSPSLVELVSLAVAPHVQNRGLGKMLIEAAEKLARERGHKELFAISLAEALFLAKGWKESSIVYYPEKIARYQKISRSELSIGRKFCFRRSLTSE